MVEDDCLSGKTIQGFVIIWQRAHDVQVASSVQDACVVTVEVLDLISRVHPICVQVDARLAGGDHDVRDLIGVTRVGLQVCAQAVTGV